MRLKAKTDIIDTGGREATRVSVSGIILRDDTETAYVNNDQLPCWNSASLSADNK